METEELNPIEVDEEFDGLDAEHDEAENELQQLNEVATVLDTIKEAEAVNRATAVTLESMNEDLLPTGYSIKSYTQAPSRTNLTPTLESITGKIWSGIKKIWEYIKKFFKKIGDWIKGIFGAKGKVVERDQADAMAKKAKEHEKEVDKIQKSLTRDQSVKAEEAKKDLVAEYVDTKLDKLYTKLTEELIKSDEVSRRYISARDAILDSHRLAYRVATAVKATIDLLPRKEDELYANDGMLKRQIIGSLKEVSKANDARTDGFLTAEMQFEVVRQLSEDISELEKEPVSRTMDEGLFIEEIVEFWKNYRSSDERFVTREAAYELFEPLSEVGVIVDGIDLRRQKISDDDIVVELKNAMRILNKHTATLTKFQSLTTKLAKVSTSIYMAANSWMGSHVKMLEKVSKEEDEK